MRRLLWLGAFFLSASWLFFIPQFIAPDLLSGVLLIILGVLCTIAGVSKMKTPAPLDQKYYLLLIPLLLSLVVISFPYNIGILVLLFGILLFVVSSWIHRTYPFAIGLLLSGVILLLQTAVFPFYVIFISHGHRIDLLSPLVSWVGNILGLHTSTANGLVFLQTIQQTVPVTTTWEKLGLFLWLDFFLGALLLLFLSRKKRMFLFSIPLFLATSFVYLILRYIAVLYGYQMTDDLSVFWNPVVMALSFLPLALLLMKLLPLNTSERATLLISPLTFSKKHLVPLLVCFLFVFSILGACTFQDPGTAKNGRVLIDEYHSQWEDTIRPLDTEWYGQLSTYNYYSWAQWLTSYYDVTRNTDNTLTSEQLNKYDILILKCPTQSYTSDEIRAIRSFVRTGGGLYLIGDHTNVFGMNTFLNQVSEQFGIRFNTDATYELGTGNLSVYQSDALFSHAVMRHVPQFEFMTSCTVEPTSLLASFSMENIIIGDRVTSEPGTYATENFFRESVGSADSSFGYLLQVAAMKYGQGRVVAFSDSTVFSSFSIFTNGYQNFTLGVLEYLNRTNTYAWGTLIFLSIALLTGGLFVWSFRSSPKLLILWVFLFSGILAVSAAVPLFSSLTDTAYPLPTAQRPVFHVAFDQQHSSVQISLKPTGMLESTDRNYGTFYVWTQRVGCVPSIENSLADAIAQGNVVVIINPTQSFSDQDLQRITSYLEHGGRILLMDSITNPQSTANELLGTFGIWISTDTSVEQMHENISSLHGNMSNLTLGHPSLILTGGTPLLLDPQNTTHACIVEFSNQTTGEHGKLVVLIDSYSFCDTAMGNTFTTPSDQQRQIYSTEFFLFNNVLKT
jgi:hypothetical protein